MVVVYKLLRSLNLYDSPALQSLATQAWAGRQLTLQTGPDPSAAALTVCLQEDNYPGWIAPADLQHLQPVVQPYQPPHPTATEIRDRIPQAIAFAEAAMGQPNVYLWGGTLGPDYDCSGLVQHAFATHGIWLPRDAYQQEAFVQPLANPGDRPKDLISVLEPGDLIFFGTPAKATHVAIYLGHGAYIHSSGKDQGRNGIGVDTLDQNGESVSRTYYAQVRGAGRIVRSYQPGEQPWLNR